MKGGKSKTETRAPRRTSVRLTRRITPKTKSVAAVGKTGGEKWKLLSDSEKDPFVAKADKRKVEYEKTMKAYNMKLEEGAKEDEEESDKSVSEVNDEYDADEEEEDD